MKASIGVSRLALWVAAVCLLVLCSDALARERGERRKPEKAKKPTVVGMVAVEMENDEIKSVTLTAKKRGQETVYNVELDDNGKKLGEELDGKKVMARGTVSEKDGKQWLTVERYREVTSRKRKPPKED
jgi:hypothetical protein